MLTGVVVDSGLSGSGKDILTEIRAYRTTRPLNVFPCPKLGIDSNGSDMVLMTLLFDNDYQFH